MSKSCPSCGETKPASQFYETVARCKPCHRAAVRENRARRINYYRAYDRNRAMTAKRKALRARYAATSRGQRVIAEAKKRWMERNAFKRVAQVTVGNALRDGRLQRKPCETCGCKKVQAHHPDYSRPLEVRWLCVRHHRDQHRKAS